MFEEKSITPIKRLSNKKSYYTRESLRALRQVLIEKIDKSYDTLEKDFASHKTTIRTIAHQVRKG